MQQPPTKHDLRSEQSNTASVWTLYPQLNLIYEFWFKILNADECSGTETLSEAVIVGKGGSLL